MKKVKKTTKKLSKNEKYIISQADYVLSKGLKIMTGMEELTNKVINLTGGYISYNPTTDCGKETALCFDGNFYILLGDFRKDLKGLKTIEECIKVFDKLLKTKKVKESPWSSHPNKVKGKKK